MKKSSKRKLNQDLFAIFVLFRQGLRCGNNRRIRSDTVHVGVKIQDGARIWQHSKICLLQQLHDTRNKNRQFDNRLFRGNIQ